MTVVAPETIAREALIEALRMEFAAEQFPVMDDKLHASLGEARTVLGVFPERSVSNSNDKYMTQFELVVQFYGKYNLEVNREETVSPSTIESFAERFRQSIREGVDPRTGQVWYFDLQRINYPDDPTGNKTRFEAFITARGNNSALLETV
jgi:hypothetical protein